MIHRHHFNPMIINLEAEDRYGSGNKAAPCMGKALRKNKRCRNVLLGYL